jgi:hypothetical protein
MIGGETLFELRTSLQLADQERTGGIGAHVSPMVGQSALSATQICRSINSGKSLRLMLLCWTLLPRPPDPKDVSSLLQRAGFTMLTVDVEEIMMGYPSMWELMQDLKDMGEGNAIFGRCVFRVRPLIPSNCVLTSLAGRRVQESVHQARHAHRCVLDLLWCGRQLLLASADADVDSRLLSPSQHCTASPPQRMPIRLSLARPPSLRRSRSSS